MESDISCSAFLVNKFVVDMSRIVTVVMNFTLIVCPFTNRYVGHQMFNIS
jgi:hypothetical protein